MNYLYGRWIGWGGLPVGGVCFVDLCHLPSESRSCQSHRATLEPCRGRTAHEYSSGEGRNRSGASPALLMLQTLEAENVRELTHQRRYFQKWRCIHTTTLQPTSLSVEGVGL
jgi:hypothetical protein